MKTRNDSKVIPANPIQNILLAIDSSIEQFERAIALRNESRIPLVTAIEISINRPLHPSIAKQIKNIELFELTILYGIRAVSLDQDFEIFISPAQVHDLTSIIPISMCKELWILPLCKELETSLIVGLVNPNSPSVIQELKRISTAYNLKIEPRVMLEAEFQQLFEDVNDLIIIENKRIKENKCDLPTTITNLHNLLNEEPIPIIPFVEEILLLAIKKEVSEIAIAPHTNYCSVRFRIDGNLEDIVFDRQIPLEITNTLRNRLKLLANLDIIQSQKAQSGKFQRISQNRTVNFHICIAPIAEGGQVLIKVLDDLRMRQNLEWFAKQPIGKKIDRLGDRKSGLILVTGGFNSGITTTLYALLEQYQTQNRAIATVEYAIELSFPNITQVEVKTTDAIPAALRSLQKQEPEVVLVDEIPSIQVAQLVAEIATKGTVLSSFAASHTTLALTQLMDMVPLVMLSNTLDAILYQQLVRRVCHRCRIPIVPTVEQLKYYGLPLESKSRIYQADCSEHNHCAHCDGKGYLGYIAVFEIMEITSDLRTAIANGLPAPRIRKMAIANGMKPLLDCGLEFAIRGITTLEELDRLIGSSSLLQEDLKFKQQLPLPKSDIQVEEICWDLINTLDLLTSTPLIEHGIYDHYQQIKAKLLQTLLKLGVSKIQAIAQPFDPKYHEVISTKASSLHIPNTVIKEFRYGYIFENEVLRQTQVEIAI